jgi:hypothetical protein
MRTGIKKTQIAVMKKTQKAISLFSTYYDMINQSRDQIMILQEKTLELLMYTISNNLVMGFEHIYNRCFYNEYCLREFIKDNHDDILNFAIDMKRYEIVYIIFNYNEYDEYTQVELFNEINVNDLDDEDMKKMKHIFDIDKYICAGDQVIRKIDLIDYTTAIYCGIF